MQYTHLGRTGLSVSRLCLGTMNFSWTTEKADAFTVMDAAHDKGINFFDTANRYGRPVPGRHRKLIWRLVRPGRRPPSQDRARDQALRRDGRTGPTRTSSRALNIRRALDASLKRLQTDYIDLYQFHHIDRDTPWDEIWQAMEVAVQQGKILYAGSSNFAGWHIAKAQARRERAPLHRPRLRAVDLQPARARGRARSPARLPRLRPRRHPLVTAQRRPARRRHQQDQRGPAPPRRPLRRSCREAAPAARGSTKPSAPSSATNPATSPSPGCCTSPRVTAPIIGPRTADQLDAAAPRRRAEAR